MLRDRQSVPHAPAVPGLYLPVNGIWGSRVRVRGLRLAESFWVWT